MRLIDVEVRDWRGLEQARIGPLSPHLNLVTGANESGKSRIVQALWYGLFESSKGTAQYKQELQSWQSPGSSPTVTIRFAVGDAEYTLEKKFLKGAYTRLAGGGSTLDGDEAEERLRELLRTRPGKRTGVSNEDLGLWPLLWLRQGESRVVPHDHLNEDSRGWLQDALSTEIGEATAGPAGQALLQRAREEFERYFTATGQEKKPLREAQEDLEQARAARDAALAHQEQTHQTATELQRLEEEQQGLAPRIERQRKERDTARQRAEQASQARQQLALAEEQVKSLAAGLERARQQQTEREQRQQELQQTQARLQQAEGRLAELQAAVQTAETELQQSQQAVIRAEQQHVASRDLLRQVRAAAESARLRRERDQLATRLEQLGALAKQRDDIRKQLSAGRPVTVKQVQALRQAGQALEQARARLEGAAAAVRVRALKPLTVDGNSLEQGGETAFSVTEERTLRLNDVAEVVISPGGGELPRLRDQVRDGERALAELHQDLGVADLAEAEQALARRTELEQELKALRQRLQEGAPDGLDPLRQHLADIDAQLEKQQAPGDELPELAGAEAAERDAELVLQQARDARDRLQQQLNANRVALSEENGRLTASRNDETRLQGELQRLGGADELAAREKQARQAWEERVAVRDQARRSFEELGGERAGTDLEQAEKALAGLEERKRKLETEMQQKRWELQKAAESAPYESLQEQEAALESAERHWQRLERQANAARRLWELLQSKRRAAQERLTRPVMERIGPYLEDIFPGSTLSLDEELRVTGLQSGDTREHFEALSGGAQEQLGILVRVGLAEVLRGEGTLPLVLDDALINTDAERIRQIQRLLYRASRELQIILFTCHGELFDALGADEQFTLSPGRRVAG